MVVVVMVVVVMVVVVMVVGVDVVTVVVPVHRTGATTHGRPEQADAEDSDHQATGHAEPAQYGLTRERGRQRERKAEEQHAARVRAGDRGAHEHRITGRALASGDVGRHHRLAVAGQQRVRRAQHHGQQHGESADTERQVAPSQQLVELASDTIDGIGQWSASHQRRSRRCFLAAGDARCGARRRAR